MMKYYLCLEANGQLNRKVKVVREPKSRNGYGNTVGIRINPLPIINKRGVVYDRNL